MSKKKFSAVSESDILAGSITLEGIRETAKFHKMSLDSFFYGEGGWTHTDRSQSKNVYQLESALW